MSEVFAAYLQHWFGNNQYWLFCIQVMILLALAWLVGQLSRFLFRNLFTQLRENHYTKYAEEIFTAKLAVRIAQIMPSLMFQFSIPLLLIVNQSLIAGLANIAMTITVWHSLRALFVLIDQAIEIQDLKTAAGLSSMKSYIQLIKLIASVVGAIVVIALLIGRSPLMLLSGLGALSAVIMLIFKDTILSFAASVQLATNDMLKIGDWIDMPQVRASGDVIDITLNSVKVKNFDNSIVCIPTWKMMVDSFTNNRNVLQVGAYRMIRALPIATTSVRFVTPTDLARLQQIELLRPYLAQQSIVLYDDINHPLQIPAQQHFTTNIELFVHYAEQYLKQHPRIAQDMTLKVRQSHDSVDLLQLDLYCFVNTVDWGQFQAISDAIMAHLIAVAPFFILQPFQRTTVATSKQPPLPPTEQ